MQFPKSSEFDLNSANSKIWQFEDLKFSLNSDIFHDDWKSISRRKIHFWFQKCNSRVIRSSDNRRTLLNPGFNHLACNEAFSDFLTDFVCIGYFNEIKKIKIQPLSQTTLFEHIFGSNGRNSAKNDQREIIRFELIQNKHE